MWHIWVRRVGLGLAGALLALLLGMAGTVAIWGQQPVVGVFSRIYLGGTGTPHCEIRWGSASPLNSITSVGCALYMQTSGGGADSVLWYNLTGPSSAWVKLANQKQIGIDFYAKQFGAVCDGATDDTAALQATVDAAYTLGGTAGKAIFPPGTCNTTGIAVGPITVPWQVSSTDPLNETGCVVDFTSGDNTHFTLVSGCTLDPAHVGNSFTFSIPLQKSTIAFDGTAHLQDGPAGGDNHWFKYYNATITGRTDATHGTMTILGLSTGSLDTRQFPDLPHAANCVNLPSGVPGTGCTASYWCHEHSHLLSNCGPDANSAVIDSLVDIPALATYQAGHGGTGHLFPYQLPVDVNTHFVSLEGASDAVTTLRWTGNTTGIAAVTVSKNKYYRMDNIAIVNGTQPASAPAVALAGVGAGNVDNGVHGYRVACVTSRTTSTWSDAVTVTVVDKTTNGKVNVTSVATCANGTARTIYRTKVSGTTAAGPYYLLTTLADNVTTSFLDNVADASLSATVGQPHGTGIGMYMGGLPGPGAQTIGFRVTKVNIQGFHTGLQLGDNLGGEPSDGTINQLSVSQNDRGIFAATGSFNTLDVYFNQINGGENAVGVLLSGGGNFYFNGGGFSFNGVDFWGNGSFGPVTIKDFRSEGPGRFWYGDMPQLVIENTNVAEPSGARPITGNVTAVPDNVRIETIDVTSTTCPANICPITFGVGDVTGHDPRKVVVLPGLGPAGADVVATINSVTSTTAGTIAVTGNNTVASTGPVSATIYETNTVDLTFPSGQVVANDVGAAFKLPEASVTGVWSNSVRVYLTSYLSATTGKGYFVMNGSANGSGPVSPAGGTTANPTLFDNTSVELTSGNYNTRISQLQSPGGLVKVNPCNVGTMTIDQSIVVTAQGAKSPVTLVTSGSQYVIAPGVLPSSGSAISSGIQFAGALASVTCVARGGNYTVIARNNYAQYFAGPITYLSDYTGTVARGVDEPLISMPRPTAGTITGNYYSQNYPADPVAPLIQFSRVKQLSEAGFANGHNLRMRCTFGPTPGTPSSALAGAGAGNVDNGAHTYYVTFNGPPGINVSSGTVTTVVDKAADGKVALTSIPLGPTGTTDRAIWRTPAGSSTLATAKLLTTIADNTTTIYTDNTADSGLGVSAPTYAETTCNFQRLETYTYNSNGTGGTTHNDGTATYRVLVTSGHFSQADVGKIIAFPDCCGDFASISGGPITKWAIILSIVDATHIDTRDAFSNIGSFPAGTTTGSALVGQDEPDALWLPALWGWNSSDPIYWQSFSASGIVLRSTNVQSTAGVLVGIVR